MSAHKDNFHYSLPYTVPIRDINYGGHVGNDVFLSYFHEARIGYLKNLGYSELNIEGLGIILAKIELDLKAEIFHGDSLHLFCRVAEIKNTSFIMEYLVEKSPDITASIGKTVLVMFDYAKREIRKVPQSFRDKVAAFEHWAL
ncbi:MAG: thioesterase [Spirochaetae bacterium HGW-Spirochaetae-6]|nr:MAG: thioesterase [Spirochaetae bacterium HGW-Spirochaetae-6]